MPIIDHFFLRISRHSKTEYEKKLLNLRRKRISELLTDDFVKAEDTTDDESDEKKMSDPETIRAYSMYITEVISAFIFDSNPTVNMNTILPAIKESAAKVIRVTKYLIEVSVIRAIQNKKNRIRINHLDISFQMKPRTAPRRIHQTQSEICSI